MLSAENVALENRAIRLMLQIREKELMYITNKYNAMGTQAALVGGFTVTTLTSISVTEKIPSTTRWFFFLFSAISLACSLSCILNATFVTVWGPGLALRGPRGSMAKAYYGMVYEQRQIFGSFVTALFFFAMQSIVAFWIIDADVMVEGVETHEYYSWLATLIMVIGGSYATYALLRMHRRFHALSPDELDLRPSLPFVQELSGSQNVEDIPLREAKGSKRDKDRDRNFLRQIKNFKLMGGGLSEEELRASVTMGQDPTRQGKDKARKGKAGAQNNDEVIPTNFHGYLQKKSHHRGGMQYLHGDPWKQRWFVLEGGNLYYYISEEEWKSGKPPRNEGCPILLGGYEVMVNPKDFDWGFMLESVGQQERDWELRASSEKLRLAWIKTLLNASLMGGNRGSDLNYTDPNIVRGGDERIDIAAGLDDTFQNNL